MSNIINLSLSELVSNIKDKKISSKEVTNTYIERSKKSKHLNSYNEETFEDALIKSKQFFIAYVKPAACIFCCWCISMPISFAEFLRKSKQNRQE